MRIYLIEEKERDISYNIYAWVLEEKYYLENDEVKQGGGSSIPYKFVVNLIGSSIFSILYYFFFFRDFFFFFDQGSNPTFFNIISFCSTYIIIIL